VIGDTSFHERRQSQRAVNTAKVVIAEPKAERSPVILQFLAEAVGESREATKSRVIVYFTQG
jgi:hypothetical protein